MMASENETVMISKDKLTNNAIDVISLMMICGISPGGATARRQIRLGAVFVNGTNVTDDDQIITSDVLQKGIRIRAGKKLCKKVVLCT